MLAALWVVCAVTGVPLVALILVHKGTGEGATAMVGGGGSSDAARTAGASRNLTLTTVAIGVVWLASIVAIAVGSA